MITRNRLRGRATGNYLTLSKPDSFANKQFSRVPASPPCPGAGYLVAQDLVIHYTSVHYLAVAFGQLCQDSRDPE